MSNPYFSYEDEDTIRIKGELFQSDDLSDEAMELLAKATRSSLGIATIYSILDLAKIGFEQLNNELYAAAKGNPPRSH
jgi:hypothetical protein